MNKKFKSLSGSPIRIALLSGHSALIGTEWTELRDLFHQEAYAAGAVSEDMFKNRVADRIPTKVAEQVESVISFDEKILEAINKLVEEGKPDTFTKAGIPDAQVLTQLVGDRVLTAKRDQLWYKYKKDNGID